MSPTTVMIRIMMYFLICIVIGKLFRKNFLRKRSLFVESQPVKSNHKITLITQAFESTCKFKAVKYHIKYHIFKKFKIWFGVVTFLTIFAYQSHFLNIVQVLFIGFVPLSHIMKLVAIVLVMQQIQT